MPHKRPPSPGIMRESSSLKYTMDSMMTRSDSFSLTKRKPDGIKEMLNIVKTQAANPMQREGTDFELKKKRAPLPGIGTTTSLNIVMETGPDTPRIYVDKPVDDYKRSDSILSNDFLSRSQSILSASLDESSFLSPRQEYTTTRNFAQPKNPNPVLTKNLVSRSMETFPRHTPRKAHRLRPMGQRRLSSVPESRLSALSGSRSKGQGHGQFQGQLQGQTQSQILDDEADVPLPKFPSSSERPIKRSRDKKHSKHQQNGGFGTSRPNAPMPDVSSQSVLFEDDYEDDYYQENSMYDHQQRNHESSVYQHNQQRNESPRSDMDHSTDSSHLPLNTKRMHRKQQHERQAASRNAQNNRYYDEEPRYNTPIVIRDDISDDDLIDYVIED